MSSGVTPRECSDTSPVPPASMTKTSSRRTPATAPARVSRSKGDVWPANSFIALRYETERRANVEEESSV